jgi:NitT/TauT family transport system substrate-binding protein
MLKQSLSWFKRTLVVPCFVASLAFIGLPSISIAQTALKFNLGWKVEASGAGFLVALQKGYFKQEGLDVTIDVGNGSAGAITQVAAGVYDAASADIATLIEHNVKNPDKKAIAAMIQYDLNPNSIMVKKSSGIAKPADLMGKKIAGQPFNASRKLFPMFAAATKVDPNGIQWQNIEPGLGDTQFIKGEVEGVAYFYFTGLINLKGKGLKPEELTVFRFSDFGVQSYGNAIVIKPKLLEENPKAAQGLIRAITKGWLDVFADPSVGAKAVKAREPLADEALELERLQYIVNGSMITPAVRENGYGHATEARLRATINEVSAALDIKSPPSISDIYTDKLLPPKAERMLRK